MIDDDGTFTSITVDSSPPSSDGMYFGSPPYSALFAGQPSSIVSGASDFAASPPPAPFSAAPASVPASPPVTGATPPETLFSPPSTPSPPTDVPVTSPVQAPAANSSSGADSPPSGAQPITSTSTDTDSESQAGMVRYLLFALELAYLVILLAAALLYHYPATSGPVRGFQQLFPAAIGPVPLAIPWFGALGAVVRGLSASFGETVGASDDADESPYLSDSYNRARWHISRPLMGAALGIITYIIFLVILVPSGNSQLQKSDGPSLLAFLVGYSDGTFTSLIRRAVDVILGPGRATNGAPKQ